jgi:Carbohydrate binding domain/EGF domain/Complement Clr-like EGF-like
MFGRHGFALSLLALQSVAACSDPQCAASEVKVGTVCRSIPALSSDASSAPSPPREMVGETVADPQVREDARVGEDSELDGGPQGRAAGEDAAQPSTSDAAPTLVADAASKPVSEAGPTTPPGSAPCPSDVASCDDAAMPDPCAKAKCDAHATCAVVDGTAVCTCTPPFIGDGHTCASCDTVKCGPQATCKPSTATCECNSGFAKASAGASCEDIDECKNPTFCTGGKTCTNAPGTASCACPPPTWSGNLLSDPGFESISASWGVTWFPVYTDANNLKWDAAPGHSGAQAVRVTTIKAEPWKGVYQNVELSANRTYRLSAWARASAANPNIRIGVKRIDTKEEVAGSDPFGNTEWRQWVILFKIAAEGQHAVLFGALADVTDAWIDIDDVVLEELTSTVCE